MTAYPKGIYATCTAEELEAKTAAGWLLIAVLNTTQLAHRSEMVPVGVNGGGISYPGVANGQADRHYPVEEVRFLLFKDEASVMVEAVETIKKLEEQKAAWDAESAKQTRLLVGIRHELAVTQRECALCKEAVKATADGSREVNTRAHKLEADLGKVRTAIGDIEYQRIVGG